MSVSQPSTLLLEEGGTFEGAAPEQCSAGEDRFQEPITWIEGRITVSF